MERLEYDLRYVLSLRPNTPRNLFTGTEIRTSTLHVLQESRTWSNRTKVTSERLSQLERVAHKSQLRMESSFGHLGGFGRE